jgi:hypothetical protein
VTTKASIKAQSLEAQVARLLAQCEHAGWFRFEVPGAPSITIHVEPDGMGRWAVTRYGWQDVMAWTASGWQRCAATPDDQRFVWPLRHVLDTVPGLLAALDAERATWKLRRLQAERAAALAGVVEEVVEPYRAYGETLAATGQQVSA